ncbi:helix-turn-helix transcriptional regulator [Brevundimonas sp.]|jgi:transcriptional regulator with XRE-family HTH domain|uniref:helix-turn-helix domain-containing protein n=1 Tax=Brevundimonas sp. TaxID=1871086 RepID=UPI0012247A09|nr:helix-turn-helix transcriptional regulator [Brevundimonas sp.]MDZ4052126.1 helix-turn-helix transcriptional regulator [Phenylobacterium sp.]TAJ65956.1 MAG: XRE family transcriptional regulator [Brevundimonas sp.]
MELQATFGQNVRRIRLRREMTIEALAQDAGLSYSYLGEIERGLRNPTLAVIEGLADSLAVEPHSLLQR